MRHPPDLTPQALVRRATTEAPLQGLAWPTLRRGEGRTPSELNRRGRVRCSRWWPVVIMPTANSVGSPHPDACMESGLSHCRAPVMHAYMLANGVVELRPRPARLSPAVCTYTV